MRLSKITEEEFNPARSLIGTRTKVWEYYNTLLGEMVPDEWMAVELGEGETKAAVRNQLRLAAKRANAVIDFRHTRQPKFYARLSTAEISE